jgi:hypothetical protein
MNHSNYTGVAESLTQSFKDLAESIRKGFGIFSEQENRRIHYLCSKGFSLEDAKIVTKLENGYTVSHEELKRFAKLLSLGG